MDTNMPAYGLWVIVFLNAAVFILFAFSFARPQNKRDWRAFGAFSAFIVALFAEMYGFPLTIYLLSGWLGSRYPGLDLFSHNAGHLWETLLGWQGDPHLAPPHFLSYLLIAGGFILLPVAWYDLYTAQREHRLAVTGLYARVRHPQYIALGLIMLGFLFQWPTLLTLIMFPILVVMYVRLARHEELDAITEFGQAYADYAAVTPAFFPHMHGKSSSQVSGKNQESGGPNHEREVSR